jgi:rare lipoprotein A
MSGFAKRGTHLLAAVTLSFALAACGGGVKYRPVSDATVRIGPPYTIRGVTYTPAADPDYDMLGYATWYGNESGNQTANGERFRPDWYTAAHRTLPLPSYVEVTSLDTGRRIIVRVNDRGPFTESTRIIDLSKGAAELLGMRARGKAAVRVRVVEPSEKDRAALRKGKAARALSPIPARTLANLQAQFARGVGAL